MTKWSANVKVDRATSSMYNDFAADAFKHGLSRMEADKQFNAIYAQETKYRQAGWPNEIDRRAGVEPSEGGGGIGLALLVVVIFIAIALAAASMGMG